MSKYFGFAVVGTIAMLCLLSFYAFPGSASQSPAFNGTTLAGWHVLGPAGWRVEKGEIVGSAKAGVAAWLVLDHAYEDLGLSFSFRCNGCDTGVLWRSAKAGAGTEGTYLSLAGSDAGTVYRVALDAQGAETGRKSLGAPNGQNNKPVQFTLNPNGWNEVSLFVSGDQVVGYFNDNRIRAFAFGGAKRAVTDRWRCASPEAPAPRCASRTSRSKISPRNRPSPSK
jgi:hypothetical protein